MMPGVFLQKDKNRIMIKKPQNKNDQYPLEFQTVEFCLLLDNFITKPGQVATLGKGGLRRGRFIETQIISVSSLNWSYWS